jgi:murein DD-endopeptidase MepM/ murein hydrolase activator NlpD
MAQANEIASRFFDYLLASNSDEMAGFKKWRFQPGMLFKARETWWGKQRPRPTPHEGLDLCCFEDVNGEIKQVNEHTRVPATLAGTVIKIDHDFLGKSIYLSHEIYSADQRQLYTAYGHTEPCAALEVGKQVAEGEIIAVIAADPGKPSKVLPHLHLTLAWMPVPIHPDRLDWQNLGTDPAITLIDPLSLLPEAESSSSPIDETQPSQSEADLCPPGNGPF